MNVRLRFIGEKEFENGYFTRACDVLSIHSCIKVYTSRYRLINKCNVLSCLKFQIEILESG